MATLFDKITHDDGTLDAYNATSTNGGNLSAEVAAALNGSVEGMNVLITSTTTMWAQRNYTPPASGVVRFEFWFDPNSISMGNDDNFDFFRLRFNDATLLSTLRAKSDSSPGFNNFEFRTFTDAGAGGNNETIPLTDEPHFIRIVVRRASTNVSADGEGELWVDGVRLIHHTGIDNFDRFVQMTSIRVGPIGLDSGTSGTFFVDEIEGFDTEAPPEAAGGAGPSHIHRLRPAGRRFFSGGL